jgi:DNA repair exonuclease SbcCD ATPase subunit
MVPISITIKNFKSYGDNETTLNLVGNCIRLLNGVNGCGKSSFVEAILWCLFGKSSDSADEVVNRKIKKDCKVEFIFKIGEDEYSIIRFRKHTEHKNKILVFKNQKDISPLRSDDTQGLINEIIGLNYRTLTSSMVFSTEFFTPFLRSRPSDRLTTFESVLSLRDINRWSDTGKLLKSAIDDEITGISSTKERINFGISSIKTSLEDYKLKVKENLLQFKRDKDELIKREVDIKQEIIDLSEINFAEELKKNEDYDKISKNNAELAEEIRSEISKLKEINKLSTELFEVKEKIIQLSKINVNEELLLIEEKNRIKNENLQIESKISELKSKIIDATSLATIHDNKKKELDKIKSNIEIALKSKCPECNQIVRNSSELLEKYRNAFTAINLEINEIETQIGTADEKNTQIETEISSLKSLIKEDNIKAQYSPEFLKKIEADINSLKTKKEVLDKELTFNDEYNTEIELKIAKLKNKVITIGETPKYSTEFLKELGNKIETLKLEIVEIKRQLENIDDKAKTIYDKKFVEEQSKKIETLATEDIRLKGESEKVEYKKKHYEYLLSLFSNKDGGIKKEIINRMITVFNQEINKYLPLMFDSNIEMYFDKNLSETIILDGEQVRFGTFSIGEKARLEFAVTFSMFLMVKLFFSANISLIVFDEVLDVMGLDKSGLDAVLKIIDGLGETNSILVISHNENLKDYFSNYITIRKEKGFSYIE